MRSTLKLLLVLALAVLLLVAGLNLWGYVTLGTLTPDSEPRIDAAANRVVMIFGATGSVGDGLLKAALEDDTVERIHIITRRTSPRIDEAVASGRARMRLHEDFTDYTSLSAILGEVNTVMWALGTSSLNVDDATYTRIHVDFPVAFVRAWLGQRTRGPMAFHYVTGMGTDPEGGQHWAREKGRAEQMLAELAAGTGLRTFSYRSAFIRPTAEQSNALHYLGEALLKPGYLVISGRELGHAMLEISARTRELPNGTLVDNRDSVEYARAYAARR
ncbi:MAG: hypothetical protein U5K56_21680 [Halioglobus sp.]|nr:hypothetical protein [Halioglobus sp.]